ncbi:glycosyltransferase [Sphingomonas sp. LY54]|uniref:glycosyltransferase n=1 Tax=Sphingomonas sp. LY54 TaxID=3095343 RepID=UPI002D7937D8|nr:glycosyltransferase [Sphingomonas sp. LY54]WRP29190.1 glycosyltransferase [Sphingomonas sp. LY54]
MLRALILSSRFPDAVRPYLGNFILRQAAALAERDGVEVRVVAPVLQSTSPAGVGVDALPMPPEEDVWKGVKVYWPHVSRWTPDSWSRELLPTLRRLRDDSAFDVIHADFFWPDGPAVAALAAALDVPLSIKARGADLDAWSRDAAARQSVIGAIRRGGGLLAVSARLRDRMIGLGLPADRISVHYTGIDRTIFKVSDRAAAQAALRLKGPVLLLVGNLIARKGQALAIETLAHIPEATLLLAGGGPDREALEGKARAFGLSDRVRMLGPVPQELLPSLYAAASVTLSLSQEEGLANVQLESLACGTPVVATDIGGAREAISNPAAGRLVDADPVAIAAAAEELVRRPPDPRDTAASADRFSWDRNAEELEEHLRRLVAPRP